MYVADLPGYLRSLQDAAAKGAPEAATAMATDFQDRMVNVTLRLTAHPPGQFWKATEGSPPAYASGNLARSVFRTPAKGLIRATALVGATARYAAIQEFGGWTWPRRARYMKWENTGGVWRRRIVHVPDHPYFATTLSDMMTDGSLSRAARDAFWARISPLLTP